MQVHSFCHQHCYQAEGNKCDSSFKKIHAKVKACVITNAKHEKPTHCFQQEFISLTCSFLFIQDISKIKSQRVHFVLTFLQQLKRTQNLQESEGKKVDANLVLDNAASMSPIDITHNSQQFKHLVTFLFWGYAYQQKKKNML